MSENREPSPTSTTSTTCIRKPSEIKVMHIPSSDAAYGKRIADATKMSNGTNPI